MPAAKHLKAINFDLVSDELVKTFGASNRTAAYGRIRSFMEAHGFEHRQGSGYRSLQPISDFEVADLVVLMYEENPWLATGVRRLNATNIGSQYDLHGIAVQRLRDLESSGTFDLA